MSNPLVSIVIPFYENIQWLKEALESVKNQTYKNFEVLIINDGSKENIDKINKEFNYVLKVVSKVNGGPASARNMGIEKSKGKYIAFLDSDDVWLPEKLEMQVSYMELNKSIWSQHSYEMFWDNHNKSKVINTDIYQGDIYRDCFISFKVQTSCVMVLREILITEGICFNIKKRYGQDLSFYKELAKNYKLGTINGVYSRFRIRGSNAGFRARVQIGDKGSNWEEFKGDKKITSILPPPILFAYRLTSLQNKILSKLQISVFKKESHIERLSKLFYLTPYSIFKFYGK